MDGLAERERDELLAIIRRLLAHKGECWDYLTDDGGDRLVMCKEVWRLQGRIGIPGAPGLAEKLERGYAKVREQRRTDGEFRQEGIPQCPHCKNIQYVIPALYCERPGCQHYFITPGGMRL
jgi:hypothetical protein